MKKFLVLILAGAMVAGMTACTSKEEEFPNKQISVICPLGAGGASDSITRLFAAALQEETGVSVVVENVTGAGGGVGLEAIAASEADGYTLGYIPAEVTTVEAMGNATVTPEDFIFLGSAMQINALIAVPTESEWDSLDDLIAAAQADPGAITIGTAGVGNAYELGFRQLMQSADMEMNVVNFSDGTAAAITALLGNNVDCVIAGTSEAKTYVESGQFKLLAHISAERSTLFPDVPTATELGYPCNGYSWGSFGVPVGTPDDVVAILREASEAALNSEALVKLLEESGFGEYYIPGDEFQSMAEEMYVTNSAIIEEFNLSAN